MLNRLFSGCCGLCRRCRFRGGSLCRRCGFRGGGLCRHRSFCNRCLRCFLCFRDRGRFRFGFLQHQSADRGNRHIRMSALQGRPRGRDRTGEDQQDFCGSRRIQQLKSKTWFLAEAIPSRDIPSIHLQKIIGRTYGASLIHRDTQQNIDPVFLRTALSHQISVILPGHQGSFVSGLHPSG